MFSIRIAAWLHVLIEMLIYVWKHVAVFAVSTHICIWTQAYAVALLGVQNIQGFNPADNVEKVI